MKKILYLLTAFALISCSDKSDKAEKPDTDSIPASVELDAHALPIPQVPDSITNPSEKIDYMMLHFWDEMDFNDASQISDTLLIEQTFSNFAYLLPNTSGTEAMDAAMAALVKRASVSPEAVSRVSEVAEKYLYDVESPLQSETLFGIFLEQLIKSRPNDADRYRFLLDEVKQNEVGSIAPDFRIASTSLSDAVSGHAYTILMFYEHDCADCQMTIKMMNADSNLAGLVNEGAINVVAIDLNTANDGYLPLPAGWIGAQTSAPEDMYVMRRSPSIYLLDSDRRIVLKDTAYPVVAACLR